MCSHCAGSPGSLDSSSSLSYCKTTICSITRKISYSPLSTLPFYSYLSVLFDCFTLVFREHALEVLDFIVVALGLLLRELFYRVLIEGSSLD